VPDAKNLTTPEVAAKILGKNFISLDEALKIFPNKKSELTGYDLVPFSQEALYHCSEEKNPFILIPALPKCGKSLMLTVNEFHKMVYPKYDFFASWTDIHVHQPPFIYKSVCEPRWYLISKKAMEAGEKRRFCAEHEWSERDFEIEHAVVYVYAWILFKMVRNENIFLGGTFECLDTFSRALSSLTVIDCQMGKIHIGHWRPSNPKLPDPLVVPSVEPYTPNSRVNGNAK